MVNKIRNKMKSDSAAAMSGEMLGLIALAMFAVIALFTFVLKPIQESAELTGNTFGETIKALISGKDIPQNTTP